jgi:hypothetical protein
VKKTIVAMTAAAFLAAASLPAFAENPINKGPVPLPAIGLLPIMLVLSTKENKNFKPVNPYAKHRRHHRR